MRFTNFGSIVKTYKKNFQIRKEKFIAERKAIQAKKKKDREDLIEAQKQSARFIKLKGQQSKKVNFLGDIKKFLGFMLAGFILQNLKTILPVLQNILKKIGDIIKGTKEFLEGVIGGITSFFEGLDENREKIEDLLSPILNADLSKFIPFQNQLDKVLTGVLGIANIITGLYGGEQALNQSEPIAKTAIQGAAGASGRRAVALKRLKNIEKIKLTRLNQEAAIKRAEAVAQKAIAQSTRRKALQTSAASSFKSPGQDLPIGTKLTDKNAKIFLDRLFEGKSLQGGTGFIADEPGVKSTFAERAAGVRKKEAGINRLADAIEEIYTEKSLLDSLFDEDFVEPKSKTGISVEKLLDDDYKFKPDTKPKPISPLNKLLSSKLEFSKLKPAAAMTKLKKVMSNARGFMTPSNFVKFGRFGAEMGIGVFLEFFAGWLLDRGLEAIGFDSKSLLEKRLTRFLQLSKEDQKKYIERLNIELEKELNFQKSFFGKLDKVIALGDTTINEMKIKQLSGLLTAISVSGATPIYDVNNPISAAAMPEYLGGDVDILMSSQLPVQPSVQPSTPKISIPSVMPPLPPTGTLGTGAQAYGAVRPGGRKHAGVDFDPADDRNSKFYSRIGGEVIYARNAGGGYGNVVDIYNAELGVTERIAEGNIIHVKKGDIVNRGTLVQSGSEMTGVFHYEIRKGRAGQSGAFEGTLNPLEFLKQINMNRDQSSISSIKTSSSNLISSVGLDQPTSYSSEGMSVKREVNNIFIPINA